MGGISRNQKILAVGEACGGDEHIHIACWTANAPHMSGDLPESLCGHVIEFQDGVEIVKDILNFPKISPRIVGKIHADV